MSKIFLACEWLGNTRKFTSRAGRDVEISEVWVKFPDAPYPQKLDVFGKLSIPQGRYAVPVKLELDRYDNLAAALDWDNARQVQDK